MGYLEQLKQFFIGTPQQEQLPPSVMDIIKSQEETKKRTLENMESARLNMDKNSVGVLTNTRPENYFGGKFVPEEAFTDRMMPRKKDLAFLEDNILPDTRAVGIPDALVASGWANESARGTSEAAINGNNHFGLGPNWSFDSISEGTKVYIKTVLTNSGLGEKGEDGVLRLKKGVTADQLLDALAGKYEMHMKDKGEYGKRLRGTPEWNFYSQ